MKKRYFAVNWKNFNELMQKLEVGVSLYDKSCYNNRLLLTFNVSQNTIVSFKKDLQKVQFCLLLIVIKSQKILGLKILLREESCFNKILILIQIHCCKDGMWKMGFPCKLEELEVRSQNFGDIPHIITWYLF